MVSNCDHQTINSLTLLGLNFCCFVYKPAPISSQNCFSILTFWAGGLRGQQPEWAGGGQDLEDLSNVGKELFTDGDRFVIDFPPNCPPEMKVFLRLEIDPLKFPIAGNHPGRRLPLWLPILRGLAAAIPAPQFLMKKWKMPCFSL